MPSETMDSEVWSAKLGRNATEASAKRASSELRALSDHDLDAEREYIERRLVEMLAGAFDTDELVDRDTWRLYDLRRLAVIVSEQERRERIGYYRRAQGRDLGDFARVIKHRVDLDVLIVHDYPATRLRRVGSGKRYMGHCPFHADATPSLLVYPDHWWCFGCSQGGDVYDWLIVANVVRDFVPAVEWVASYAGVQMPGRVAGAGGTVDV